MIGSKIGKFRITQELGDGGHAFVFKGEGDGKVVAIKMLRPSVTDADESLEKRFIIEAEALKKLNHPNIVGFEGYLFENGHHYMVLEYMDQGSADNLIRNMGAVPHRYAVPIFYKVIDAIRFAHDSGYIHRDIKPNNILINSKGEAKLSDFGIAKVVGGQNLTSRGYILGTTQYMAPECISKGEVTKQTDIYALGVTFYEILTGRKPFEMGDEEQLISYARRVCQGNAPPPSTYRPIPAELEAIVMKSLAQDPKNRYKTPKEIQRDLAKSYPDLINKPIAIKGRAMTDMMNAQELQKALALAPSRTTTSPGMASWMMWLIIALVVMGVVALAYIFEPQIRKALWPGQQKILTYGVGAALALLFAFLMHRFLGRARLAAERNVLLAAPQSFATESSSDGELSGFGDASEDGAGDTIPFHEGFSGGNEPFKMTDVSELKAYLVAIRGRDDGRRFGLRPVSRIGRDLRVDIRPHDNEISRHHAVILFDGVGFTLEDLGSTNGTFVNEERVVAKRRLKNGDIVRVGATAMRFEYSG